MNALLDVEIVQCPVCGPSQTRTWLNDGKLTQYVRCLSCGAVYASPRSSHKQRYAWLDETFSLSEDIFERTAARVPALKEEARLIQSALAAGRILDVGCSIGTLLSLFPKPLWNRFGVELSASAANYAVQTHAIQVHTGSLTSADYPDMFFDVVTLLDTLYYLDDPSAEFREISRIVRPGGLLAIEIPGQTYVLWRNYGLVPWVLDGRWSRAPSDSSYLTWFNLRSLKSLLDKWDFEVTDVRIIGSPISNQGIRDFLAATYYKLIVGVSKHATRIYDLAPKYCVLARRKRC